MQCIEANRAAQDLRRDRKLADARRQLQLCTSHACPPMVRDDCTKRLDEVDKAQPTIAFLVRDASGSDVTAVNVSVDGKLLATRLDGTALAVDIGEHVFTFEIPGRPTETRTLTVTEGEKGRHELVTVGTPPPQGGAPVPAPAAPPGEGAAMPPSATPHPSTGSGMRTQKVLGLVAGGVGVAAVAVGGVFGAMSYSEKSQQQSACGSSASCTPGGHADALNHHSTGLTDATISTVGFVAGGVLLAGGALLFFTAHPAQPARTGSLRVVPSAGPRGAGVWLEGGF
jgi:hypothetical protein